VLLTVLLMGAPMFIPERIFAKIRGGATLVVSLLTLLGSIAGIISTFSLVILMVALFLAFPSAQLFPDHLRLFRPNGSKRHVKFAHGAKASLCRVPDSGSFTIRDSC
jgi:hypothetical protein